MSITDKKEQIIALFDKGNSLSVIAEMTNEPVGYVGHVLRQTQKLKPLTDFIIHDSNLYHRFFNNVLHFGTIEKAKRSIKRLDSLYTYFEEIGDRGGQHQAMVLALTGMNKARWSGKKEISELFREWIVRH